MLGGMSQKLRAICERIPAFTACIRLVNFFYLCNESTIFHVDGNRHPENVVLGKSFLKEYVLISSQVYNIAVNRINQIVN